MNITMRATEDVWHVKGVAKKTLTTRRKSDSMKSNAQIESYMKDNSNANVAQKGSPISSNNNNLLEQSKNYTKLKSVKHKHKLNKKYYNKHLYHCQKISTENFKSPTETSTIKERFHRSLIHLPTFKMNNSGKT